MESRAHRSVEWTLSALELTAVRGDHGSREQGRNSVHKLGMDGQTAKHLTEMFRESEFCCGSNVFTPNHRWRQSAVLGDGTWAGPEAMPPLPTPTPDDRLISIPVLNPQPILS